MIRRRPGRALAVVPLLIPVALVVGLVVGSWGVPVALAAAAVVGLGVVGAVSVRRGHATEAIVTVALAMLVAGAAWGSMRVVRTTPLAVSHPGEVSGEVVVDSPAVAGEHGVRARVEVRRLHGPGAVPPGTRLLLDLPAAAARPGVGYVIRLSGTVSVARRPGSPAWWDAWLRRQGISGRLRAGSWTATGTRGGLMGARDALRRIAGANVAAGLSGDRAALVHGMALGGGAGLSEEAAGRMRDSGLWHLLAVSGQNVAVIGIGVSAVLMAMGMARRGRIITAGVAMAVYCVACDGGASVARAGLMGAVALMADLRGGHRARWHALVFALAVLLAIDPLAISDPGLQLSFAAVVGLFIITPPVAEWLRGWVPARVADLLAQSVGAGLGTAPVLASGFGGISTVGLLANLIAVPVAGPVVVIALAGTVANIVWAPVGRLLAMLAALGAGIVMLVATVSSAIPGAITSVPAWSAVPLVIVAGVPPLVWWWLRRIPGQGSVRFGLPPGCVRVAVLSVAVLVVCLVPGFRGGGGWPPPPGVGLRMLDVGQGSAIVLRSGSRADVLVDAGPPGDPAPALSGLEAMGATALGALVLSHGSADHAGGAEDVLRNLPVGRLVLPEPDASAPIVRQLVRVAREHGVPVAWASAGTEISVGAWTVEVVGPVGTRSIVEPNDRCLVVVARARAMTALLPGDAESGVLRQLALPSVDILQVSHHGSEDSGLPEVLARARPLAALISSGQGNAFGHPRVEVLRALGASGARVLRTDSGGGIDVRPGSSGIVVVRG